MHYEHRQKLTCKIEGKQEEKTWDNLEIGDVIKDECGDKRHVLDVHGRVIDLSTVGDKDEWLGGFTKEECISLGWKIANATPTPAPVKMTHEEIEKALGYKVEIIKE